MDNLPQIIRDIPDAVVVPVMNAVLHDVVFKKFVLCITRDLNDEDKALFRDYRFLEYDDNVHKNIPVDQLRFDFLVIDLREKGDRYAYMKEIQPRHEKYHIIVYCHGFEQDDLEIQHDNAISSFPARQARREDWEMLLLMKRIAKPRWWVSLLSCVFTWYNKGK
jgi:hypothetical protein